MAGTRRQAAPDKVGALELPMYPWTHGLMYPLHLVHACWQEEEDNQPSTSGCVQQPASTPSKTVKKQEPAAPLVPGIPETAAVAEEDEDAEEGEELEGLLDAWQSKPELVTSLEELQDALTDPTAFLQPSSELSQTIRRAAKVSELARPCCNSYVTPVVAALTPCGNPCRACRRCMVAV